MGCWETSLILILPLLWLHPIIKIYQYCKPPVNRSRVLCLFLSGDQGSATSPISSLFILSSVTVAHVSEPSANHFVISLSLPFLIFFFFLRKLQKFTNNGANKYLKKIDKCCSAKPACPSAITLR